MIIGKNLFKSDALAVFDSITYSHGLYFYREQNEKRFHKVHGIVLIPNTPNEFQTAAYYWLFPNENKLFLKASRRVDSNNSLQLAFQTSCPEIDYNIQVKDDQQHQIRQDLSIYPISNTPILEFVYNHLEGLWHFNCVRCDLFSPNTTEQVFSLLEIIAENLTKEELIFRLRFAAHKSEAWDLALKKIRKSLMEKK